MKKVYLLLMVAVLLLTGCVGKDDVKDVSVTDALCPYKIEHKEGTLEITLQNGEKNGLTWQVKTVPEDVCKVSPKKTEEKDTALYCVTGAVEGAAQITFTGAQEDQTAGFVLTIVANVNADKEASLSSYQHRERNVVSVKKDGLNYQWNVDVDGVLNFSFTDSEDTWSVRGEGGDVCNFISKLATPSGCTFSAEAISAGKVTVELVGDETQRKISVVLQVDDAGKMEVISVQEQ